MLFRPRRVAVVVQKIIWRAIALMKFVLTAILLAM